MQRVRFSTTLSTPHGTHLSGTIAEVPDDTAKSYVEGGVATLAPADMTAGEMLAKIAELEGENRRLRSQLQIAEDHARQSYTTVTADRKTGAPVEAILPRRRPPSFPVAAGRVGGPAPTPETGTLATDGHPAAPVLSAAAGNADAPVDPQATANTGRTVTVPGVADDPATSSPAAPIPPSVGEASPGASPPVDNAHVAAGSTAFPDSDVATNATVPANGNAANVAGLSASDGPEGRNDDLTAYDAQPGPSQASQAKARAKEKAAAKGKPAKSKAAKSK